MKTPRSRKISLVAFAAAMALVASAALAQETRFFRIGTGGTAGTYYPVGALIAKRAVSSGVTKVVFDRGGYLFHGRVKALADAAREGGLVF